MDGMLFPKLEGDVGYDLVVSETTSIEPHSFANVPHKVAVKLPKGFWGIILARSGTNIAGKLIVLPGVIDTGYTGRLFALLHNVSNETIKIKKGTRVCQLILIQAQLFPMLFVSALPSTERGDGGFGSTGGTNGKVKNPNHEE
jgi:dUTP pyrophosphatase